MSNIIKTTCARCKCSFGIPDTLYETALHSEQIIFYCPYGHQLHYTPTQNIHQIENQNKKEPEEERTDNVIYMAKYRKENE